MFVIYYPRVPAVGGWEERGRQRGGVQGEGTQHKIQNNIDPYLELSYCLVILAPTRTNK